MDMEMIPRIDTCTVAHERGIRLITIQKRAMLLAQRQRLLSFVKNDHKTISAEYQLGNMN